MRRKGKSCIAHNKAAAALLRAMQDSPLPRIIAFLAHRRPSRASPLVVSTTFRCRRSAAL